MIIELDMSSSTPIYVQLINSRRKVQDIASDVGYSDASHFIVMFKKLTGMTPAQFRKLHI